MSIKIRRDDERHGGIVYVKNTKSNSLCRGDSSVQANLLFAILEKLEEIRCGIIDVETEISQTP